MADDPVAAADVCVTVGASGLAVLVLVAGPPFATWPVTDAVALVTGASGCPAAGEAVCCPVVAPAVGSCVLPVPAAPVAVAFWTGVPELWESVLARVVLGLLAAGAEEPVPEWLVGTLEEALPDWVLAMLGEECPARVCDVALTAELAVELAVETGDSAEDGGGGGSVAACACRENTSRTKKIPAAAIESCTARRAMRRAIGCGMRHSHPPDT